MKCMIIELKKHERNYPIVLFFYLDAFHLWFHSKIIVKIVKKSFYCCSRPSEERLCISILAPDGLRQVRAFLFLLPTVCVKSVRFYSCSRRSASSLCKNIRKKYGFEAICTFQYFNLNACDAVRMFTACLFSKFGRIVHSKHRIVSEYTSLRLAVAQWRHFFQQSQFPYRLPTNCRRRIELCDRTKDPMRR